MGNFASKRVPNLKTVHIWNVITVCSAPLLVTIPLLLFRTLTWDTEVWLSEQRPISRSSLKLVSETDRAQRLERFKTALRFPTVSYDEIAGGVHQAGPKIEAAFNDFNSFLDHAFPALHDGRYSSFLTYERVGQYSRLYIIRGSDENLLPILLTAHMDVVPVDPSENWLTPPFAAEEVVENGETYIYGRGSLAEKQSVMGILEAVDFFLHTRGQPRRSIVVAIGHDGERRGMDGARNMAMILFQRNYRFAFVLDNGLAITAGVFPGVPSPLASVGVTEKGYANLQLEISALRPGTSSVPPAETAIGVLAGAVSRLEQNPLPHQFTLGSVEYKRIETAGRSATFWHRLVYANLWLFSPLVVKVILSDFFAAANIRTTTVTTSFNAELKLNEVPPKARAIVNHRLHPDQLFEDVMIHDFSVINDDRIKVRILEFSPSAFISPFGKDVWAYRILVKSILEVFPNVVSVVPGTVLGNSDSFWYLGLSSYIYRFTPCVYKSDDLKRVRGINERISVRNFHQVMDFYFRIIMNAQPILDRVRLVDMCWAVREDKTYMKRAEVQ